MLELPFRFRRGAAAEWIIANPILRRNEPGVETDTHGLKVGDGTTPWRDLPYALEPDVGNRPWLIEPLVLVSSLPPPVVYIPQPSPHRRRWWHRLTRPAA